MEFLADVACEFASSGVDGMAMEGGWTLVEEGRGLDSGVKPRSDPPVLRYQIEIKCQVQCQVKYQTQMLQTKVRP